MQIFSKPLLSVTLNIIVAAGAFANEPLKVLDEGAQIQAGEHQDITFTAPAEYANQDAVLVVTAWVYSATFRGYCQAARIALNETPLTVIVNRGPEFELSDGRKEPSQVGGRWSLPYSPSPNTINEGSPYYVRDQGKKITELVLIASGLKVGENTLRISHDNQYVEEPLMIESVVLTNASALEDKD